MDFRSDNDGKTSRTPVSQPVEQLGREFVSAWLNDNQQRIEPFLQKVGETHAVEAHDVLIRLEIFLRNSEGQPLQLSEYYRRFPEHAELIEKAILPDDEPITGRCLESVCAAVPGSRGTWRKCGTAAVAPVAEVSDSSPELAL